MSYRSLCTLTALAWTLTGCSSLHAPSAPPVQIPASLRQPCPPLVPPADGSAAAVLRTLVEWAGMYRECADGKAALIEATTPKGTP